MYGKCIALMAGLNKLIKYGSLIVYIKAIQKLTRFESPNSHKK